MDRGDGIACGARGDAVHVVEAAGLEVDEGVAAASGGFVGGEDGTHGYPVCGCGGGWSGVVAMAVTDGFVGAVSWVWELDFVAEFFFAVGNAVSEDDADGFVEVVASFARAADVDVYQVAQRRSFVGVFGAV